MTNRFHRRLQSMLRTDGHTVRQRNVLSHVERFLLKPAVFEKTEDNRR